MCRLNQSEDVHRIGATKLLLGKRDAILLFQDVGNAALVKRFDDAKGDAFFAVSTEAKVSWTFLGCLCVRQKQSEYETNTIPSYQISDGSKHLKTVSTALHCSLLALPLWLLTRMMASYCRPMSSQDIVTKQKVRR